MSDRVASPSVRLEVAVQYQNGGPGGRYQDQNGGPGRRHRPNGGPGRQNGGPGRRYPDHNGGPPRRRPAPGGYGSAAADMAQYLRHLESSGKSRELGNAMQLVQIGLQNDGMIDPAEAAVLSSAQGVNLYSGTRRFLSESQGASRIAPPAPMTGVGAMGRVLQHGSLESSGKSRELGNAAQFAAEALMDERVDRFEQAALGGARELNLYSGTKVFLDSVRRLAGDRSRIPYSTGLRQMGSFLQQGRLEQSGRSGELAAAHELIGIAYQDGTIDGAERALLLAAADGLNLYSATKSALRAAAQGY